MGASEISKRARIALIKDGALRSIHPT